MPIDTGRYGGNVAMPYMAQATDIYGSMAGQPIIPDNSVTQPGVFYSETPQGAGDTNDTWRFGSPGDLRKNLGGSSGGGGSIPSSPAPTGPAIPEPVYEAPPAPTMPTYTARDYEPPEEDTAYEAGKRRELMGAGTRELRSRTQEAILTSKSLDNPNARAQFVKEALSGYGEGMEKVSRGATASASAAAARKRTEDLNIYNAKYSAKSREDLMNYQNEINRLAADFASAQWGAQQEYSTARGAFLGQPQANVAGQLAGDNLSFMDKFRNSLNGGGTTYSRILY